MTDDDLRGLTLDQALTYAAGLITDDELAAHPDPRVDPGICGVVARTTVEGAPLAIERICILPPHDPQTKSGNRGLDRRTGYYPTSERHYMVTRYPNRATDETPAAERD